MKPTFVILGCRGTMPVSGKSFVKYGGGTSCFCLKTKEGIIVVDAGTGIFHLDESRREELPPAALLFTHFHLDHLMGLPFFGRFHNPKARVTLMGDVRSCGKWRSAVADLVAPPYWPVPLSRLGAKVVFKDLPGGKNELELYGVKISWCSLCHPQGCLAYRFETGKKSVAIVTDHESGRIEADKRVADFCAGVDFLIHDAQFTGAELKYHRGWGHSSWEQAVRMARRTDAGRLILTHHDVGRDDAQIDAIVAAARRHFSKVAAAAGGMVLF